MSEKIGCMNCGNISCKNNKKRESKGCGRWKTPEQRILELEEKVSGYDCNRDRLIAMGFPTFASCKEYAAKLKELEEEIARTRTTAEMNLECWKQSASKLDDAIKIMKEIEAADLMKVVIKAKQYLAIEKLQNFLKELEG